MSQLSPELHRRVLEALDKRRAEVRSAVEMNDFLWNFNPELAELKKKLMEQE